jgi:tRNA G10  N-methylase Trm11
MTYAFIIGRVYKLCLAEISQIFKSLDINYRVISCSKEVLIIETDKEINHTKIQKSAGGIIKIIKIFDIFNKKGKEYPSQVLDGYFTFKKIKELFTDYTGKKQFGISIYNLDPTVRYKEETTRIAFLIKKTIQDQAINVRAVLPQFPSQALSSVQVTENNILSKGAEIDIIVGIQRIFIGKTLSVQDYEDYGRRDYQRPARDEISGMIPPKVAQSMINMSDTDASSDYILDPFCGSGTILQEALLLGLRAIGSDIDKKAIINSEKNLEWFRNRYKISPGKYKLFEADAKELSIQLPKMTATAVVTEGTLGPIYLKPPKKNEMEQNFNSIEKIYNQAFKEFKQFIAPGSRVVICLPAYKISHTDYVRMPNLDFALNNGYNIQDPLDQSFYKYKFIETSNDRKSIIYDRKDQVVAREIFIFQLENINQETVVESRQQREETESAQ